MHCPHLLDFETDKSPTCTFINPVVDTCLKGLQMDDIPTVLAHCYFERIDSKPFILLEDGGILILNKSVIVKDGEKIIYNPKPLILYTPSNVLLTLETAEYNFPEKNEVIPKIITSRLTKDDIYTVLKLGSKAEFWKNFRITDYDGYIGLLIDATIAPLLFISLALGCKRYKKKKALKKNKKEQKSNYKKNRRLMRTTEL